MRPIYLWLSRLVRTKAPHAGAACLGGLVLALALTGPPAAAQTSGPALGPRLQDATIIGHGDVLTIRRMPVVTPTGTVYRTITIELKVDAQGMIQADASSKDPALAARLAPGSEPQRPHDMPAHDVTVGQLTETATPPEVAAPFTPGTYRDDAHGGLVRVTSDGNHLFEGFPTWSLSSVFGGSVMDSAEWYAGPLRTNPHHALLQRAGITSEAYSYGVVDGSGSGHFDRGMLIGVVQSGRTLTIVSFHRHGCCTYSSTPTSQITYTRTGR